MHPTSLLKEKAIKLSKDYDEIISKLDEYRKKRGYSFVVDEEGDKLFKEQDKIEKEISEISDKLGLKDFDEFDEFVEKELSDKTSKENYKALLEKDQKKLAGKQQPKDKVAGTKILDGGIKETKDEHGRTVFLKPNSNKKVKIHKNGNSYLASYGQELKDPDGYTEFQVFPSASGKSFNTEAGAKRWALKQLANNSTDNILNEVLSDVILESCLGE